MIFLNYIARFLSRFNFPQSNHEKPCLTIVGVGPGDPSLLTLAAIDAIKNASLVAYPIAEIGGRSIAGEIASKFIQKKNCLPILFPMVKNPSELKDAWQKASNQLVSEVENGKKVVLLCQGDPLLYATGSYVLLDIQVNHPLCPVKVIPGISSFNAAAAIAKIPLSLQKENLLVCSVPNNPEELDLLLDECISSQRAIVLLKLGRKWEWVKVILGKRNLLDETIFAERVGFSDQIVVQSKDVNIEYPSYFSMLIIRKKPVP